MAIYRVASGLGPKAQVDSSSWGEPRLVGLQGVASCRHLAYDTTSACLPNSSRRFSARLVWVSRLRLPSSGSVPDPHAGCLLTALVGEGRGARGFVKIDAVRSQRSHAAAAPRLPASASQTVDAIIPTRISLARYTQASSANTLPSAIPTASLPRLTWRMLTS